MSILRGVLNQINQTSTGRLSAINNRLIGDLNVYTMETGDGREIELAVISSHICWRRVGDVAWLQLLPLSAITPIRGTDYFTQEDIEYMITAIESAITSDKLDKIDSPIVGNIVVTGENNTIISSDKSLSDLVTQQELSAVIQDKYYTHRQSNSSSVWVIHHNLNKMPSITVKDSAGTTVIGELEYIDCNTMRVIFSGAFSGVAYLN